MSFGDTIQRALHSVGFHLSRFPPTAVPDRPDLLRLCASLVVAATGRLGVVQVGANDGAINDPVYGILMEYRDHSEVLLIEPQAALLPYLRANYASHPRHEVIQSAVGSEGLLRMYGVSESVWADLDVAYAKDWPVYRAPTGVTSADRRHVENWLSHYWPYWGMRPAPISEFEVPCRPLSALLAASQFNGPVDLLQVDAEGHDDTVLYASDLAGTQPLIIHYEDVNLGPERASRLSDHLRGLGYEELRIGDNVLAIRSAPRFSGLAKQ